MLGDKIGEFSGGPGTSRVLPGDDHRYVKLEISFQDQGTLLGGGGVNMGTITLFERVPGQIYSEGRGIFQGGNGGVIWNCIGVGTMSGEGMAGQARVAVAFQAPTEGPLARLNGVLGVLEQTVAADGSTKTTVWEWK